MKTFNLTDDSWNIFLEHSEVDPKIQTRVKKAMKEHADLIKNDKKDSDAFKKVNKTIGAIKGATLLRVTLNVLGKMTKRLSSTVANYPLTQETYNQLQDAIENLLSQIIKARESGVVIHDTNVELGNIFDDKKKAKIEKLEKAS